ncbi:RNA polymerase sigma-70 factor, sigma-E family [Jatrophihabitans endophyticus]|uniref:RNA polymerase sigma-70 factor, sigma-E family n=1 Tax=Jatrophihabitans endophyticus TaxID=1206085 RepID=A0A1M5UMA5_9ACTN|nr:SigE family RNA polymerase sigma factor [Jatrophihabitans endophyticus]SHH63978.1 RNA polymerase sigma-70 factor, sigma-E family [Jatrophihabitans endophyticus]
MIRELCVERGADPVPDAVPARPAGDDRAGDDRAGDAAASFDAYVLAHRTALVRYATLLAGSPAVGEDLVQDVLVKLYPRWGRLADPHPYVRRCVTNEFLSWRRRWSTRAVRVVPDAVLEQVADAERDEGPDPQLWARLARLPGQQRAAVVLRYWEGLADAEIGAVLGCKPATVRGHVSRGLATLRAALAAPAPEDDR